MGYSISRHDVNHPAYAKHAPKFAARRAKSGAGVEKNPLGLGVHLDGILLQARVRLAMDPEAGFLETWEEWTTAMQ